ncbi:MAG: hypothetical protein FWG35_06810, partial [Spirochaetaceae bacterium]|nr:hypothetical protein [Spirochaetaceae bacterium]
PPPPPAAPPPPPPPAAPPVATRPEPYSPPSMPPLPAATGAQPPPDFFPPAENVATITTGPLRQISGVVGQTFTVNLPGIGWIYMPDEEAAGKIRYLGKVTGEGSTVFTFSPFAKGDYNLKFQQQDLAANTLRYDDVKLAVDAEDLRPIAANPSARDTREAPAAPAADPVSPSPAPVVQAPAAPPAPVVTQPVEIVPPGETELQRLQRLAPENAGSLAELEHYIGEHEAALDGLDEWYFLLATMFEKAGPARDMKKALLYYEKVRNNFPLSARWQASDVKSRYIRLNYFDIR